MESSAKETNKKPQPYEKPITQGVCASFQVSQFVSHPKVYEYLRAG